MGGDCRRIADLIIAAPVRFLVAGIGDALFGKCEVGLRASCRQARFKGRPQAVPEEPVDDGECRVAKRRGIATDIGDDIRALNIAQRSPWPR
jgi:hypothetical protein